MQLNTSNGITAFQYRFSLSEQVKERVVIIGTIARLVVRVENLVVHQQAEEAVYARRRYLGDLGHLLCVRDRVFVERVDDIDHPGGTRQRTGFRHMIVIECVDLRDQLDILVTLRRYRLEEKLDPLVPFTFEADVVQKRVVLDLVPFKSLADEEARKINLLFRIQIHGDQHSAHTPVAIHKGVDGLELRMDDGCADERPEIVVGRVDIGNEVVHQTRHIFRRRGNESDGMGLVLLADIVLRNTVGAHDIWLFHVAAHQSVYAAKGS